MNRKHRRALTRNSRITRASHRLAPQACTLWVPAEQGYLVGFSPRGFHVADCAELAKIYYEDEATSAALAFREITGLRVAVRPFYCKHQVQ